MQTRKTKHATTCLFSFHQIDDGIAVRAREAQGGAVKEAHFVVCPAFSTPRAALYSTNSGDNATRGTAAAVTDTECYFSDVVEIGAGISHALSHILDSKQVESPAKRQSMSSKMGLKADPMRPRAARRRGKAWAKSLVLVVRTRLERRRLLQALQRDVSFLTRQKVVGYSLIVGRRRMEEGEDRAAAATAAATSKRVGATLVRGGFCGDETGKNGMVGKSDSSSSFCLNLALEDVDAAPVDLCSGIR